MVKFSTFDRERNLGPLALVRKFLDIYEPDEVTEVRANMGHIKADAVSDFGSFVEIEVGFLAGAVADRFVMKAPTNSVRFDEKRLGRPQINSQDFTSLEELGGDAGTIGRLIKDAMHEASRKSVPPEWEFVEVDAASLGHQYLTDYEFKYQMTVESSTIEGASESLDEVI